MIDPSSCNVDGAFPSRPRKCDGLSTVSDGVKLLGVELDSFFLFGFGDGEADDDRDNTAESGRFGDLLVSTLGNDGLKLPDGDLTLILVRRLGSLCFRVLDPFFLTRV